ncbi:MAG: hypothetical protein ABI663_03650 [Chryseolinea sp.]
MKTSERRSDKKTTEEISTREKVASKINSLLRKLADYLKAQSEKLSSSQKKLALALFGLLMGGICLTLTIRPFYSSPASEFNLPEGMTSKALVIPPAEREAMFSEEDYLMLMKFKSTLDSLYKTDRPIYDELLRGREGLLDSINFLISIYKE